MENTEKITSKNTEKKVKKTKEERALEKSQKAECKATEKAQKAEEASKLREAKKKEKAEKREKSKAEKELLKQQKEKKPIDIVLAKKRVIAQASIAATTTAAVTVAAVPIPFPDSNILVSLETSLVKSIFKSYDINISQEVVNAIIGSAAITAVAKRALNSLKAIPNIAASVINAVVAGFFVAALGEAVCALSEAIITGKIDKQKLDSVTEYITAKLTDNPIIGYMVKYLLENATKLKNMSAKEIYKIIFKSLKSAKKAEKQK